jgi:hypothetical protein
VGGEYGDRSLVVIGVRTPEFAFEKNVDNVRQAAHPHAAVVGPVEGLERPISIVR